ncbi:DEAD/DEAH box helicase [Desulfopila inferna]|uniref:DEAD/DEAH box helicase n=1 Tax=Desulfopila inferna TaxID=468528 RepID=UPI0019667B16|nr:DEAD/DEAH box helicase [Desulfopila inferna]MBM9603521.1 DEAD/DEAH box helicase [Desulfopila inferna]
MIINLITTTRLKIKNAVMQGKRKSLSFLPGKFRNGTAGENPLPPEQAEKKNENSPPQQQQVDREAPQKARPEKKKKWQLSSFQVDPLPGKVRFHDIGLPQQVMRAIADLGFQYCTPVQAESLPHLLEGKDLVANANTGTGKTAVFLMAILTRLLGENKEKKSDRVRTLILAPTRELVIQIAAEAKELSRYTHLRVAAVYGGTEYRKQMEFCEKRCDIVVATPGRLLDFCQKGVLNLQSCEIVVIDEADRMLDMGFIPDVRRIMGQLPNRGTRQTLMFSATITEEVKRLASQWCKDPVNVVVESEQVAVESVDQKVYLVTASEKYKILYNLIKGNGGGRIVVFANQKAEARKLYERLRRNEINCTLLTGDVPQTKRTDRLERFRAGGIEVLVATDVAGRGLHVEGITHVVNYSLPYEPEDYVHRIGRTGRAGAAGVSVSFACEEGSFILPDIEEFMGKKLECFSPEEHLLIEPPKGVPYSGPKAPNSGSKNYKAKSKGRSYHGKRQPKRNA